MANPLVGPLVRAISSENVTIWTEWSTSCDVTLTAVRSDHSQKSEAVSLAVCSPTIRVGARYYALSQLTGLEPATWYNYRVSASGLDGSAPSTEDISIQCFRTLDLPNSGNALRLAYGSCRKLAVVGPDALSALGDWLVRHLDEREILWPRLLLLIGDQIYADEPAEEQQPRSAPLPSESPPPYPAQTFEDFARMYASAWTSDEGIRQVLAALPTWMIFDDHELSNNWNISPLWQARILQHGEEQMLVDGLVAYWIYQGWGNLGLQTTDQHDLQAIMQQAMQSGEDALEALRQRIRQALFQEKTLQWDYTLPTTPPIFVGDMRAGRSALLTTENHTDMPPRILSQEQMARLRHWTQEHETSTLVLVSSVPALLPPAIGLAEYVMGVRPFHGVSSAQLRRLGRTLAERQQSLAERLSFDHWPAFGTTWHEFIEVFDAHKRDVVILSGDVHFSYAMSARRTLLPWKRSPALYQLVASPFRNTLSPREKRLILGQAWIKRGIYGGLSSRILPLLPSKGTKRPPSDLLFQNVVAFVTFWPSTRKEGQYDIRQVYLGVKDQMLEEIASFVASSN